MLKKFNASNEMIIKEFLVGKRDLESAEFSFEGKNYKWATIQAYYAVFHAVRALLFKAGYREESHYALKITVKELYFDKNILDGEIYKVLEKGKDLRELADYKERFSKEAAENLVLKAKDSISKIEKYLGVN